MARKMPAAREKRLLASMRLMGVMVRSKVWVVSLTVTVRVVWVVSQDLGCNLTGTVIFP